MIYCSNIFILDLERKEIEKNDQKLVLLHCGQHCIDPEKHHQIMK